MATDPPQAETLSYWLRRFKELRDRDRQTRLEADLARLEAIMHEKTAQENRYDA